MSSPTATPHSPALQAEQVIRECKFDPATVNQLNKEYKKTAEVTPQAAAGWHGPDDIQTLVGLEGNFLWTEDLLKPSQIQFKFDPGHVGEKGTYKITSLTSTLIEQGMFSSVPNNPAIGWAFINLVPQLNPNPRTFIVQGMMTDQAWKISILLLSKAGQTGTVLPPFFAAIRIS